MDGNARPCSATMAMDCSRDSHAQQDSTSMEESITLRLPNLPSELIDHILAYLSPVDLARVSSVNHFLRAHATTNHLWQSLVQAEVPGVKVTTPAPCASFRDLYVAHDPHWFLTKYKVWFCDKDLTGKMMIARYDQARGVIEGHQLLANCVKASTTTNSNLIDNVDLHIHEFNPEVKLHLDKPILLLQANSLVNLMHAAARKAVPPAPTPASVRGLTGIAARWVNTFGSASTTTARQTPPKPARLERFAAETAMSLGSPATSDKTFHSLLLTKAMPETAVIKQKSGDFPYGNMWPPPAIPAAERVSAAHYNNGSPFGDHGEYGYPNADLTALGDRPLQRSEISNKTFRVRSWMQRPTSSAGSQESVNLYGQSTQQWTPSYRTPMAAPASHSATIWDSVSTYSTLDPDEYTPTADKPWKGIWVGDYSGHGCEFLLVKQNHTTAFDEAAFDATRSDLETEGEFARRKADARKYRGSLEAVKLTGDANVPRGECTFRAADLGEAGYETTIEEEPFKGTRVVKSQGHVAMTGFINDRYIPSQLLLISENRLAQYWVNYNHVSFFERVDIDKFLAPN